MDDEDAGRPPPTILLMLDSWQATLILGLVFIVLGVVLIRHLHLTLAVIGLLVGLTWIVQGVAGLMSAFSGPTWAAGPGG